MTSAEGAVRARALALLGTDAELGATIHGVFDGTPPRASAPYVAVGAAEGSDWGTKDRIGREVRLTLALYGAGSTIDDRAAGRDRGDRGGVPGADGRLDDRRRAGGADAVRPYPRRRMASRDGRAVPVSGGVGQFSPSLRDREDSGHSPGMVLVEE